MAGLQTWRYRACPMVQGRRVYGHWKDRVGAAGDYLEMRQRAKAVAGTALVSLGEAMRLVLERPLRPETARAYREHFRTLVKHFGADRPLHTITAAEAEKFRKARRAQRHRGKAIGETRINKDLGHLRMIVQAAIDADRLPEPNLLRKVKPARVQRREADCYQVAEVAELLAAIRTCDLPTAKTMHAVISFLFFTGARLSELARCKAEHHNGKLGTLHLRGKTAERTIPVCGPLASILGELIAGAGPDGYLLPTGEARGPRVEGNQRSTGEVRRRGWLRNAIARYSEALAAVLAKQANGDQTETLRHGELLRRFHCHTFRHTLKTYFGSQRVPDYLSDAYTGHKGRGVARRYEHANLLELRQVVAQHLDPLAHLLGGGHAASGAASG